MFTISSCILIVIDISHFCCQARIQTESHGLGTLESEWHWGGEELHEGEEALFWRQLISWQKWSGMIHVVQVEWMNHANHGS